jgi:hypothetical protein
MPILSSSWMSGKCRDAANAIRRSLSDRGIPVDVAVVTPAQFERDRNTIGTLVHPVMTDGSVLYAPAA